MTSEWQPAGTLTPEVVPDRSLSQEGQVWHHPRYLLTRTARGSEDAPLSVARHLMPSGHVCVPEAESIAQLSWQGWILSGGARWWPSTGLGLGGQGVPWDLEKVVWGSWSSGVPAAGGDFNSWFC